MTIKIGAIGLGIMGGAFSGNLIKAGFEVVGYDISSDRMNVFSEAGGVLARSTVEVINKTEIAFTSLPTADAFNDVMDQIVTSDNKDVIVMECSTLSLEDKLRAHEKLAQYGMTLLDCPISGTGAHASAKKIVVFASGDQDAYNKCSPVIQGFANTQYYIGPFGDGSKLKFIANLLIADHIAAAAEALVLGMKACLDPKVVHEIISASSASSEMFNFRGARMIKDDYEPAMMKMDVWQKDLSVISQFIESLEVKTPLFSASVPLYKQAIKAGLSKQDTASVCRVVEKLSGVKR